MSQPISIVPRPTSNFPLGQGRVPPLGSSTGIPRGDASGPSTQSYSSLSSTPYRPAYASSANNSNNDVSSPNALPPYIPYSPGSHQPTRSGAAMDRMTAAQNIPTMNGLGVSGIHGDSTNSMSPIALQGYSGHIEQPQYRNSETAVQAQSPDFAQPPLLQPYVQSVAEAQCTSGFSQDGLQQFSSENNARAITSQPVQTPLNSIVASGKESKGKKGKKGGNNQSWNIQGYPLRGTTPHDRLLWLADNNPDGFIKHYPNDIHDNYLWIIASKPGYNSNSKSLAAVLRHHNVDPFNDTEDFPNRWTKNLTKAASLFGPIPGFRHKPKEPENGWADPRAWRRVGNAAGSNGIGTGPPQNTGSGTYALIQPQASPRQDMPAVPKHQVFGQYINPPAQLQELDPRLDEFPMLDFVGVFPSTGAGSHTQSPYAADYSHHQEDFDNYPQAITAPTLPQPFRNHEPPTVSPGNPCQYLHANERATPSAIPYYVPFTSSTNNLGQYPRADIRVTPLTSPYRTPSIPTHQVPPISSFGSRTPPQQYSVSPILATQYPQHRETSQPERKRKRDDSSLSPTETLPAEKKLRGEVHEGSEATIQQSPASPLFATQSPQDRETSQPERKRKREDSPQTSAETLPAEKKLREESHEEREATLQPLYSVHDKPAEREDNDSLFNGSFNDGISDRGDWEPDPEVPDTNALAEYSDPHGVDNEIAILEQIAAYNQAASHLAPSAQESSSTRGESTAREASQEVSTSQEAPTAQESSESQEASSTQDRPPHNAAPMSLQENLSTTTVTQPASAEPPYHLVTKNGKTIARETRPYEQPLHFVTQNGITRIHEIGEVGCSCNEQEARPQNTNPTTSHGTVSTGSSTPQPAESSQSQVQKPTTSNDMDKISAKDWQKQQRAKYEMTFGPKTDAEWAKIWVKAEERRLRSEERWHREHRRHCPGCAECA